MSNQSLYTIPQRNPVGFPVLQSFFYGLVILFLIDVGLEKYLLKRYIFNKFHRPDFQVIIFFQDNYEKLACLLDSLLLLAPISA